MAIKRLWPPHGEDEKERWFSKATDLVNRLFAKTDTVTDVSTAPSKVGLFAVVGGIGYMSVGTSSSSDWKQIT